CDPAAVGRRLRERRRPRGNQRSARAARATVVGPMTEPLATPGGVGVADIFGARSVVVVGASAGADNPNSFNARVTRSVARSTLDRRYFVGRSAGGNGHTFVPSLVDLRGEEIDLAVIVVPKAAVPEIVDQCA